MQDVLTGAVELTEQINEHDNLVWFMTGPDSEVFAKAICYFNFESKREYFHPRELMKFWNSLTEREKDYYRKTITEMEIGK
jgi:hypothetical protein